MWSASVLILLLLVCNYDFDPKFFNDRQIDFLAKFVVPMPWSIGKFLPKYRTNKFVF